MKKVLYLKKNLKKWFSKQSNEDLEICNNDFSDYIKIIDNK